jgi:hypothetical protein
MKQPMRSARYYTLAKMITGDGRRVGVILEWDGDRLLEARRRIVIPPSAHSLYKKIEVSRDVFLQCPRMLMALHDLGFIIAYKVT